MSILRNMKLMPRDRITKVLTYLEFYHVARHCLDLCDIIFSAYDKFLACDVTSLSIAF